MVLTFMTIIVSIVGKVENNQVNQYMYLWSYGNSQMFSKVEKAISHSLIFKAMIQKCSENQTFSKLIW